MRARFLDVDGVRTRLLFDGAGSPVLLLHGLGTMAERWIYTIAALAAEFNAFAPDLLNSGFTGDISFEGRPPQFRHVKHLICLADELGIEQFSVVGSSYGGLLAALLAIEHPQRVTKLGIIGSGSALHPPDEQRRVLVASRQNAMTALADGSLAASRKRMQNIVFDPKSVPEETLYVQLTANAQPGRREAAEELYEGLIAASHVAEAQAYPRLEMIRVPTLIITGGNDIRASWQHAKAASQRIPDCRNVVYDRCGHGPMVEHAQQFNRDLMSFLKDGSIEGHRSEEVERRPLT